MTELDSLVETNARFKDVWGRALAVLATVGSAIAGSIAFARDPKWVTIAPYLIGIVVFAIMYGDERKTLKRMKDQHDVETTALRSEIAALKNAESERIGGINAKIRSLQADFKDVYDRVKPSREVPELRIISMNWGPEFIHLEPIIENVNAISRQINGYVDNDRRQTYLSVGGRREIQAACMEGIEKTEAMKAHWT